MTVVTRRRAKLIGVWGRRPQRVQGSALLLTLLAKVAFDGAEQKFAADLHHGLAVIGDDVGGGVGFGPGFGDEAAGADHVDGRCWRRP